MIYRFNRSRALHVASSSTAALLIPRGRTAHSRFHIPLIIHEGSSCNITPDNDLAGLIARAKLIIWDEAPMLHKHCFESLDRAFRDVLRSHNNGRLDIPFGGKVLMLGGDFRQIFSVIPKEQDKTLCMPILIPPIFGIFVKSLH